MASNRSHRGEDSRCDLTEQAADVLPAEARAELAKLEAGYARLDEPGPFGRWLRAVIGEVMDAHTAAALDKMNGGSGGLPWQAEEAESFLRDVGHHGLIGAVMSVVQLDGVDEERRREDHPRLPNTRIVWPVVTHLLDRPAEESAGWCRVKAIKAITRYAPDAGSAVRWLVYCLNEPGEGGYHAALQLAERSPQTPGVVDRLLDAMAADWTASYSRHDDDGTTGADVAAEALVRLWEVGVVRGPASLPLMRAAVEHFRGIRPAVLVGLWTNLGGQAITDFPAPDWLAVELGRHELFEVWFHLSATHPARVGVLARLLADWGVAHHAYHEYGPRPLAEVLAAGLPAERTLPAVVQTLAHAERLAADTAEPVSTLGVVWRDAADRVRDGFAGYLALLPHRWEEPSAEDTWLMTLCGKPLSDFTWLVYADWVEERGDDGRGHQVRLLHAHAVDPRNAPTTGPDDPGAIWGPGFRLVAEGPA